MWIVYQWINRRNFSSSCVLIPDCRSFRALSSNHFNGTIPLQLGNLMNLKELYAKNCIFGIHVELFINESIDETFHRRAFSSLIVGLSGPYLRITSMAPSHFSLVTSWTCKSCTRRIESFSTISVYRWFNNEYFITGSISLTLNRSIFIVVSQVPQLESAQWHYPSSVWQPHESNQFVRSESHCFPRFECSLDFFLLVYHCKIFNNNWSLFIVAVSGASMIISSVAPSHLSSATSWTCKRCTLRFASFYAFGIYMHRCEYLCI